MLSEMTIVIASAEGRYLVRNISSTPTALRPRRAAATLAGLALLAGSVTGVGPNRAVAAPPRPVAAPSYTLTELAPLAGGTASFALGLSSSGTAVGTSRTSSSFRPQLAVRWRHGEVENLGTLPGSTFSRAFAVNSRGQAVGEAFTAPPEVSRAVQWERDGTLRDLGTLGGRSAVANDIDERGRAFGVSSQASGSSVATVWDRQGPEALPPLDPEATGSSRVTAVTRSGDAVGSAAARTADGSSVSQAVRWLSRGPRFVPVALERLEPGRFAVALGVSENGVSVGEASRLDPGTTRTSTRAVRWMGTEIEELAPLGSFRFTRANDVTNRGEVVGFASGFAGFPSIDGAAVLWRGDRAYDLNTLVAGGTNNFVLRSAEAVNDRGQIVGFGTRDGQTRGYLLTPTESAGSR